MSDTVQKRRLAVRYEGTLCLADGTPIQESIEWLKLLSDEWDINIVSVEAQGSFGLQRVRTWLYDNNVTFDDIWSGFVLPEHDLYVDLNAVTAFKDVK